MLGEEEDDDIRGLLLPLNPLLADNDEEDEEGLDHSMEEGLPSQYSYGPAHP